MKIKNNKYFKLGIIIGPSGIGQVHIREFIKYGIRKIGLLGRTFKKNRVLNLKIKSKKDISFFNLRNIKLIKKLKPNVISICSPTEKHYIHINKFSKYCKNLIIEKPLIWIKNKKVSNYNYAKEILKNKKTKFFLNLPMISLVEQLIYKEKIKNIKNIKFSYFTKGKNIYDNIAIDLLPHAVSFVLAFQKKSLKSFRIINVFKSRSLWNCKVMINNLHCYFIFKEDKKRTSSDLSFKINDNFYKRKQIFKNGEYKNSLIKNKNRIIKINNPMSEYLRFMLNNFKNKKQIKKNNNIALNIIKITESLLKFKY